LPVLRKGDPTYLQAATPRPQGLDGALTAPSASGRPLAARRAIIPRRARGRSRIAVALHDIEPATFERCALIRDWLNDHGVDRVTLLVIPARDLHPLGERSPEMTRWLLERNRAGDSIAQHGFQHEQLRRGALSRRSLLPRPSGRSAEFVGLDGDETRRTVDAGRRLLKLAGIEPMGFVAPAYAYTPALREVLPRRFHWWAGLLRLHRPLAGPGTARAAIDRPGVGRHTLLAPAWGIGTEGLLRSAFSPALIRVGSLLGGHTLRLDLHPGDLQHPRHMMALEWVLGRSRRRREAITYDELIGDLDAAS
jgi:peptidoglycan/xylan/chitin deacetylase (PgdA/CDA1 family)